MFDDVMLRCDDSVQNNCAVDKKQLNALLNNLQSGVITLEVKMIPCKYSELVNLNLTSIKVDKSKSDFDEGYLIQYENGSLHWIPKEQSLATVIE